MNTLMNSFAVGKCLTRKQILLSRPLARLFSSPTSSEAIKEESSKAKKPVRPRKKSRSQKKNGLNLSLTKSYLEGSFLLTDENPKENKKKKFSAAEALNESSKERNQYSDILIQLQAQNQGANVSLFYKQYGGIVATRGQGALIYQDPQFSRTGNKTPFLDVANNVAGVGHSHPLVVQACVAEMTNIQVELSLQYNNDWMNFILLTNFSFDTDKCKISPPQANCLCISIADDPPTFTGHILLLQFW